jgi:hypothetical protein
MVYEFIRDCQHTYVFPNLHLVTRVAAKWVTVTVKKKPLGAKVDQGMDVECL